MLRQAASQGRQLLAPGMRLLRTSACSAEGSSVAEMVRTVNACSSSTLMASLKTAQAKLQPFYPPAAASEGFSMQAKLAMFGVLSWTLYRLDQQSRAHEWIVDLSLDVLQAAWWISFASFIPFRTVFVALRGLAPHTSVPLTGLRATVGLKA